MGRDEEFDDTKDATVVKHNVMKGGGKKRVTVLTYKHEI